MATGLITTNEIQRIDATHILADIAILTTIGLITQGIFEILKRLQKRHKGILEQLGQEIPLAEYAKAKVNQECPGRHDLERKKPRLVDVVRDARTVLAHTQGCTGDPMLARCVATLQRILRENLEADEAGGPWEKPYHAKGPELLVSPIDPDARYGAKSDTKHFTGYKANVTETVRSRFITNITALPGNRPDCNPTVDAVVAQHAHGLRPVTLIGDTAHSSGPARKALRGQGTELIAPLRTATPRTRGLYPKRLFRYDRAQNTLTCPARVTARQTVSTAPTPIRKFRFPLPVCGACPRRPDCTAAKDGRRSVGISDNHEELCAAEAFNRTAAFAAAMKLRPPIEGKLSELVRHHRLRRARYRTLVKGRLQCYFTAAAVNIKRWTALLSQPWTVENGDPVLARR